MKKITLIVCSLLIALCTIGTKASAYSGYVGTYEVNPNNPSNTWNGWSETSYAARTCFDNTGYSTSGRYFSGTAFTRSSIQNNVGAVRTFYTNSHASATAIQPYSGGIVTSNELYSWTRGFYKFVFVDGCSSGSYEMAKAFNMVMNSGQNCAYLGWNQTITTSNSYVNFTVQMFTRLKTGQTVNNAVWYAYVSSGIPQVYYIYGNYNTTMYN